jgi:SAM-dependent methyltransferase
MTRSRLLADEASRAGVECEPEAAEVVSAPPWFETFFGPDYFEIYRDFLTPERTASEVDGVVELLGLAPGARVLDLACGHGRHAIPLAERGFAVTGYDLSETFLGRARAEASARDVHVRWRQGDMRELPFHQEFEAVVNLFTSFGYFSDEADDLAALVRVRAALEPGGRFLIETLHREGLEPRFQPHVEYTTSEGAQIERDYNWDLAHDVMKDRVRLTRPDGSTAEYETAFRLRPRDEGSPSCARRNRPRVSFAPGAARRPKPRAHPHA